MVTFEPVNKVNEYEVIGCLGVKVASLEKLNSKWYLSSIESDSAIGPKTTKQIYKKLKELNNAEV